MVPLPDFPRLPELGNPPFRMLLLCWLIHEMDERGSAPIAQRDMQLHFNRADRKALQANLTQLEISGWIRVERPGLGGQPNSYLRGPNFGSARTSARRLRSLAEVLFGESGVVGDWVPREAWGTSCLGARDLLVLGVLRNSAGRVSRQELIDCLSPILVRRSVLKSVHSLEHDLELVETTGGYVELASDWEAQFLEWVRHSSGGTAKVRKLAARISREREQFGRRVAAGHLSDAERNELLRHSCVFCEKVHPRNEMTVEHWPPKVLIRRHFHSDSMHFTYPMCGRSNNALGRFLQHQILPEGVNPDASNVHILNDDAALRIFLVSSERTQRQYLDAFREFQVGQIESVRTQAVSEAVCAIKSVVEMWLACLRSGVDHTERFQANRRCRTQRGPNAAPARFRPGSR